MPHRRRLATLLAVALALPMVLVPNAISPDIAGAARTSTENGCFWSFDSTDRNLAVTLAGQASPRKAAPGETVTLSNATISASLQAWLGAYGYNFHILRAGRNEIPATIWVAIEASNTVERTQVVKAEVIATTVVTPRNPDVAGSETTATPISVTNLALPETTWKATGGSIELRQGRPGSLVGSGAGAAAGSVLIEAEFGSFDITFDCRPGTVDIVNPPYPFTPASSWAPFDTVAGPVPMSTTCGGAATSSSSWFGSARPSPAVLGRDVEVANGAVSVDLVDAVLVDAYRAGHLGAGDVSVPVEVSGSITASRPAGAERAFTVTGTLTGTIVDGPEEGTADTTAEGGVVTADLPGTSFTPDRIGAVTFSPGTRLALRTREAGWLDLTCTVSPAIFERVDVVAPTTTTTPPPASTTPPATAAPLSGGEPDPTPKTGSTRYPLACSYVYDLPGSGPATVNYTLTATGTVPTRVAAGDAVTLGGQSWTIDIPWELRGPLQTGFNVGAIDDGDILAGQVSTTLFASNTVEGTVVSSNIPARLGPVVKGQPTTLRFAPPDQTVTAVGGGPVGFEVRAVTFDVTIDAAQWGRVLVSFDCLATAPAGTAIVTADVVGVSELVAAQDPGDNSTVGRTGILPKTGRASRMAATVALALIAGGALLASTSRFVLRGPAGRRRAG